jgi:hypothetical protein
MEARLLLPPATVMQGDSHTFGNLPLQTDHLHGSQKQLPPGENLLELVFNHSGQPLTGCRAQGCLLVQSGRRQDYLLGLQTDLCLPGIGMQSIGHSERTAERFHLNLREREREHPLQTFNGLEPSLNGSRIRNHTPRKSPGVSSLFEVSSGFQDAGCGKLFDTWEMNPFYQTFSGQGLQA